MSTDSLEGDPTVSRRQRWLKISVVVLGLAIWGILWGRLITRPDGDFHLHWELGRRMAAGEYLYAHGTDYPYPPFWGLAHLPVSLLECHTAQVVSFPLFFAALVTLLWTLNKLTGRSIPLSKDYVFWSTAAAVALGSRYLVRDMPEVGVNLTLVALSYLGVWLWTQRREGWGGVSLGLAMALKCTPTLFLAWFIYKRQWRMVATTTLAAAAFTLSPALIMGPAEFQRTFTAWAGRVTEGLRQSDPSRGVLGEEPYQNMSLKLALARYLTVVETKTYISRPNHPWYVDFLDLDHTTAQWIIRGVLLALLAAVGWIYRRPVSDRGDIGLVWECAGLSLLILLYSPITWGQHCVGLLPALYVICRRRFGGEALRTWEAVALAAFGIVILALNRGFIGPELSRLVASYRDATFGILMILSVTLAGRVRAAQAVVQSAPEGASQRPTLAMAMSPSLRRAA
ncbi:MAG: DUF2029 domain-containing protein [Planctomycetaceae bacterium]|nr:DUF2029 domain-containing protein [Planctomycetaceae bacterium]